MRYADTHTGWFIEHIFPSIMPSFKSFFLTPNVGIQIRTYHNLNSHDYSFRVIELCVLRIIDP